MRARLAAPRNASGGVVDMVSVWKKCLDRLEEELSSQQFNTWLRPLRAIQDGGRLLLYAPNRFVLDWVKDRFLVRIAALAEQEAGRTVPVHLEWVHRYYPLKIDLPRIWCPSQQRSSAPQSAGLRLNPDFTFDSHVEGSPTSWHELRHAKWARTPDIRTTRYLSMVEWG